MERAEKNTRVELRVTGRVQGVFYRAGTQRRATELGLAGWVCNLPDGSVEAVAEGPRPACEALVEYCRRGPSGARVDGIEAGWGEPRGELPRFAVRY